MLYHYMNFISEMLRTWDGADLARVIRAAVDEPHPFFVLAGAGASADAVPPFRAPGSVAQRWSAGAFGGCAILVAGTGTAWTHWPRVANFFYERYFKRAVDNATPNACHRFVAAHDVPCITTNVDDLFVRAGAHYDRVAAVHGSVHREMCSACGGDLPCCAPPRPAVLFFADRTKNAFVGHEWTKHARLLDAAVEEVPRYVFVVGVSWSIPTLAPGVQLLRGRGAQVVHVNLVPPPPAHAHPDDWLVLEDAATFFARME